MNNPTHLTPMIYDYTKSLETKIGKAVFDCLDREAIQEVVLYGDCFYFEHNHYHDRVPEKVYEWIKNYLRKQGYIYGYDLPY